MFKICQFLLTLAVLCLPDKAGLAVVPGGAAAPSDRIIRLHSSVDVGTVPDTYRLNINSNTQVCVRVCMCRYMCPCTYVLLSVWLCVSLSKCMCVYVSVCVCVCVFVCVCTCACVRARVWTCVRAHMFELVCVCTTFVHSFTKFMYLSINKFIWIIDRIYTIP